MKYYNFGSCWNAQGDKNCSIFDIFQNSGIVFVGLKEYETKIVDENAIDDILSIEKGSIIIVTSGITVVAFGKTTSNGFRLTDYTGTLDPAHNGVRYDVEESTVGVQATLYTLKPEEQFSYGGQGKKFQNVHDKPCITRINELYVKHF